MDYRRVRRHFIISDFSGLIRFTRKCVTFFFQAAISATSRCAIPPNLFFLESRDLQLSKKSKIIKIGSRTSSGGFFEVECFRKIRKINYFSNGKFIFLKCVPTSKNSPEAVREPNLIIFDFLESWWSPLSRKNKSGGSAYPEAAETAAGKKCYTTSSNSSTYLSSEIFVF